jgi:hypothetical protein
VLNLRMGFLRRPRLDRRFARASFDRGKAMSSDSRLHPGPASPLGCPSRRRPESAPAQRPEAHRGLRAPGNQLPARRSEPARARGHAHPGSAPPARRCRPRDPRVTHFAENVEGAGAARKKTEHLRPPSPSRGDRIRTCDPLVPKGRRGFPGSPRASKSSQTLRLLGPLLTWSHPLDAHGRSRV